MYNLQKNVTNHNELKNTIDYSNICIMYFDLFHSRISTKQIRKERTKPSQNSISHLKKRPENEKCERKLMTIVFRDFCFEIFDKVFLTMSNVPQSH